MGAESDSIVELEHMLGKLAEWISHKEAQLPFICLV